MRNPGGYGLMCEPGKRDVEHDTFTCAHTNRVVIVKPGARPEDIGGLCKVCMGLICSEEVGRPCVVLEKRLQRMEDSARFARDAGLPR